MKNAIYILKKYLSISESIISSKYLSSLEYKFYDNEKYSHIISLSERNQIYWKEILYRAHWVCISAFQRNNEWVKGMLASHENNNFLVFAGCLRAFLESSGDIYTSLKDISLGLATNFQVVNMCVQGKMNKECKNREMEDMLIHFLYARRLGKTEKQSDATPKSHNADTSAKYVSSIDFGLEDEFISRMYEDLCQYIHPSAYSVLYHMSQNEDEEWTTMTYNIDAKQKLIKGFMDPYNETIKAVCEAGYNNPLILLKLLNTFKIKEITTPKMNEIDLKHIKLWGKISELIRT